MLGVFYLQVLVSNLHNSSMGMDKHFILGQNQGNFSQIAKSKHGHISLCHTNTQVHIRAHTSSLLLWNMSRSTFSHILLRLIVIASFTLMLSFPHYHIIGQVQCLSTHFVSRTTQTNTSFNSYWLQVCNITLFLSMFSLSLSYHISLVDIHI